MRLMIKLEIRLYAKDADGKKIYVGKLRANNTEKSTKLSESIRAEVTELYKNEQLEKAGTNEDVFIDEIDLNLEVADKFPGQVNNFEYPTWNTPTDIQPNPTLGIVLENKSGKKDFSIPNFDDYVRYDLDKLTTGAVYMILPSTKEQDNEPVYVPVRLHTKKLKLFPEKKGEVLDLLLNSTPDNLNELSGRINKNVFLDYQVLDNDKLKLNLKEGSVIVDKNPEVLSPILDELVMKVDVNEINKGDYNKTISEESRISEGENDAEKVDLQLMQILNYLSLILLSQLEESQRFKMKKLLK